MPRVRVRIHPTGHLEVEIEGMTDDGCHALVDEAASWAGVESSGAHSGPIHPAPPWRHGARPVHRGRFRPDRPGPIHRMSGTERYRIEPDGTVVTVYTDTVDRVVGHIHAVRASVVEWDESCQAWTARILATGERLGPFARGPRRSRPSGPCWPPSSRPRGPPAMRSTRSLTARSRPHATVTPPTAGACRCPASPKRHRIFRRWRIPPPRRSASLTRWPACSRCWTR